MRIIWPLPVMIVATIISYKILGSISLDVFQLQCARISVAFAVGGFVTAVVDETIYYFRLRTAFQGETDPVD